jgi:hypothetical protein
VPDGIPSDHTLPVTETAGLPVVIVPAAFGDEKDPSVARGAFGAVVCLQKLIALT